MKSGSLSLWSSHYQAVSLIALSRRLRFAESMTSDVLFVHGSLRVLFLLPKLSVAYINFS